MAGVFLIWFVQLLSTPDERECLRRESARYCYTVPVDGGEIGWCLKKKRDGKKAKKRSGKKRSGRSLSR